MAFYIADSGGEGPPPFPSITGYQNVILKECFSRFTVSKNFEELLIEYNVNFSLSPYSVNDAV